MCTTISLHALQVERVGLSTVGQQTTVLNIHLLIFRTRRHCRPKSCQHHLMDCLCGAGRRRIHRRIFSHRCYYEHSDGILLTFDGSVSYRENHWAPWQGLTLLNASMPLCCDTGDGASGLEGSLAPHMNLTMYVLTCTTIDVDILTNSLQSDLPLHANEPNPNPRVLTASPESTPKQAVAYNHESRSQYQR